MLPSQKELRTLRKKKGVTQTELAYASGFSQSMIARIESGSVDPCYSTMLKLFDSLEKKKLIPSCAEDAANYPVLFVRENNNVEKAIDIMKRNSISQLPVLNDKDEMVGSVSEAAILEKMVKYRDVKKLSSKQVSFLMKEPFPTVQPKSSVETVLFLLKDSASVVVMDKRKLKGIITKADLLKL